MGAKKHQELDYELLSVAWNLLGEQPRDMRQVMRARDRLLERAIGDLPIFVRRRAKSTTESEIADALELMAARGEIRMSEKKGVAAFAKK